MRDNYRYDPTYLGSSALGFLLSRMRVGSIVFFMLEEAGWYQTFRRPGC